MRPLACVAHGVRGFPAKNSPPGRPASAAHVCRSSARTNVRSSPCRNVPKSGTGCPPWVSPLAGGEVTCIPPCLGWAQHPGDPLGPGTGSSVRLSQSSTAVLGRARRRWLSLYYGQTEAATAPAVCLGTPGAGGDSHSKHGAPAAPGDAGARAVPERSEEQRHRRRHPCGTSASPARRGGRWGGC